jgi:CRP/FNR family transcriptional regulator
MDSNIQKKIEKFYSGYKTIEYKKGEILIKAFENPNKVYFLSEGSVKMYSISKSGKEFILNIFKPVSFFPMSLAVNENENFYYFETLSPVKVKIAPVKKVVSFVKENPDVMFDLLQRLYKGIDGLLIKLDFAMTTDAKSRIIVEIITQAKRFGTESDKGYELNISVSALATNVGLARETVSRQLKILKEKKLISVKNRSLIIHDFNKLKDELN